MDPRVAFSVLISVYHGDQPCYFNLAMLSIWDQQILKPNEIVLVQDGVLTCQLNDVVDEWRSRLGEKTFKVIELPENVGLGAALNVGLHACRYDLVARMDADDVSMPHRFETQLAFMRKHPEIVASSAQVEEWDLSFQRLLSTRALPLSSDAVRDFAVRRNPLSHPVSIFRKSKVVEVGGYPPLRKAQDYALWSLLLSRGWLLANHPDVLLRMRTGAALLDRRGWEYFKHEYKLLKYQREIGFLSTGVYLSNVVGRLVLRTMPNSLKAYLYSRAR